MTSLDLLFKDDLKQYQMLLDNYESLVPEDGETAYNLAKMMIICADRWNEIAFNASKYCKDVNMSKTDFYNWSYHRYRLLMTLHEFCRVVYKQCSDNMRNRWNEN